ncbi:hypothetical protein BDV95DRAFT_278232 [Massariosphaeria phaeospora]|uniref:F-box domain-containing protein n=1 Tax=Massariosphaeria phaeospora TaxID=100035 RepID=A0A7C8MUV7_9PLEO|nr:hypothetical protein BDV95DRAFT_278232 [Massariosphaeria phaeospora]
MFLVLSKSSVAVSSFEIDMGRARGGTYVDTKRISASAWMTPSFKHNWATHLRHLRLRYDQETDTTTFGTDIVQIATNLKTLFIDSPFGRDTDSLISQLGNTETLPNIKDLTIARARLRESSMTGLMIRLGSSLRSLTFHRTALVDGSWKTVIAVVRSNMPHLESFTIQELRDRGREQRILLCPLRNKENSMFEFCDLSYRTKSRAGGVRYHGQQMQQALGKISASLYGYPLAPRVTSPGMTGKIGLAEEYLSSFDLREEYDV